MVVKPMAVILDNGLHLAVAIMAVVAAVKLTEIQRWEHCWL
jgi:hypothetical protein